MRQHDAGLAGHARVAVGGVRRGLLVTRRDEPDAALAERVEHARSRCGRTDRRPPRRRAARGSRRSGTPQCVVAGRSATALRFTVGSRSVLIVQWTVPAGPRVLNGVTVAVRWPARIAPGILQDRPMKADPADAADGRPSRARGARPSRAHRLERDVPTGRSAEAFHVVRRGPGAAGQGRQPQGIRGRRAGLRARHRHSIRARIRSSASRRAGCERGSIGTTARKASTTTFVVDLPKGGYAPVFRRRDVVAVAAPDRAVGAPAQHDRGAADRGPDGRSPSSNSSAAACRASSIRRLTQHQVAESRERRVAAGARPA